MVREDAVGNTFARWAGAEPDLPPVATGSHIDAIPNAGMYDGTVGVLGGLEAIRALARSGYRPRRSIELMIFTSEEPTRFGIGCLGSRLMAGVLDASAGESLIDKEGQTLNRSSARLRILQDPLSDVVLSPGHYSAFVELHIEQGPLLEKKQLEIGVVTAIAAPASLQIEIEGEGGHAGAVLMPDRRDAFLAAAEIALGVEAAAKASGSRRYRGHHAAFATFSRSGEQHSQPRAAGSRRARYRSRPPRWRAAQDRRRPPKKSPSAAASRCGRKW